MLHMVFFLARKSLAVFDKFKVLKNPAIYAIYELIVFDNTLNDFA